MEEISSKKLSSKYRASKLRNEIRAASGNNSLNDSWNVLIADELRNLIMLLHLAIVCLWRTRC